jgi:hypothetical protein
VKCNANGDLISPFNRIPEKPHDTVDGIASIDPPPPWKPRLHAPGVPGEAPKKMTREGFHWLKKTSETPLTQDAER